MKLLKQLNRLEILGDGTQTRSYVHVSDAVDATLLAWRKSAGTFEVYNVRSEDWVNVNEIAEIVTSVMSLKDVNYINRPMLHGVGCRGDLKRIALAIDELKNLGWLS